MSMRMTVAYAELTRVLPWSLRALGYTFGTADRGAHFVTKAAALDPNVLDLIARAQKRRQGRMRHQQSNGKLTIDAAGMSLFEAGPAAIDYLAAHAGDAPTVACEIVGASEPSLLSALLIDAADYGICAVATSAESPDGWQAIWPRVDGAVLVQGRTVDALSDLLGGEPSIMEQLEVHRSAQQSILVVAAANVAVPETAGFDVIRPAQKVQSALRDGIPISRETLDALYTLEMLTWAPTSERSRSQAGFTVATVAAP